MDKESLILARRLVIEAISKGKFKNKQDKAELLLNLYNLLDENNYDRDIQNLQKGRRK